MSLLITNCYGSARVTRLTGRSVSIFKAPSWEAGYSHHPQITSLNGKLFASWSIGRMHEDCPGQKMVFATSSDLGETWSEPVTLVAPVRGEYAETCITSGGLLVAGESLVAYYTSYDFTLGGFVKFAESGFNNLDTPEFQSIQGVHTGIITSSNAGLTWQNTGSTIRGFVTNLSPVKLASGRLVITAHRLTAYTDDPAGVHDWKIAPLPGLPPDYYERAGSGVGGSASTDSVIPRFAKPTTNDGTNAWQGYRKLTSEQIAELAQNIVTQIRKRGPFVSLADFINRRLIQTGAFPQTDDSRLKGTIQAALDASTSSSAAVNTATAPFDTLVVNSFNGVPTNSFQTGSAASGAATRTAPLQLGRRLRPAIRHPSRPPLRHRQRPLRTLRHLHHPRLRRNG